jgi:signal transduction histidine kinase/DNA-binding response OmpR family regulator
MIKKIVDIISRWFLLLYENMDIRIKKRASIFLWIQLMNSFLLLIYIIFFILYSPLSYYRMTISYVAFEAIYIFSLIFLKKGLYKAAYHFYTAGFLLLFSVYALFIHENKDYSSIYWITIICILIQVQLSLFSLEKSRINAIVLAYSLIYVTFVFYYRKLVYPKYPVEDWERDGYACLMYIFFFYVVAGIANWITCSILDEVNKKKEDLEKEVSERTRALNQALVRIEKMSEQKTDFFINLTHETKTPLTLVNNYLEKYMKKTGEDEDLRIIKTNLDKITSDISDFFNMEKINQGKMVFSEGHAVSFSEILKDRLILYAQYAARKNISLSSDVEDGILIDIDPSALDRLINNLLENAVEYTGENGSIETRLRSKGRTAEFSVSDNGIGIPRDEQEHVFEAYFQSSALKKNGHGIGLGLSIVKNIVDQFGLKISLDSETGRGTKFTIEFEKAICETEKRNVMSEKAVAHHEITKLNEDVYHPDRDNILIIEDNVELINFIGENISKTYNAFLALNGKQATAKMGRMPRPDLVLSDIMMDGMDGYDFFKELSGNKEYADIPFIFITAKMDPKDRLNVLSSGAVDYILKPFNMDELNAKIGSVVRNKKAQMEFVKDSVNRFLFSMNGQGSDNSRNFNRIEYKCKGYRLTDKEKEVLMLLLNDNEYKEISDKLNVSINTIRTHVRNIYEKCSVNSKYSLMNIFK